MSAAVSSHSSSCTLTLTYRKNEVDTTYKVAITPTMTGKELAQKIFTTLAESESQKKIDPNMVIGIQFTGTLIPAEFAKICQQFQKATQLTRLTFSNIPESEFETVATAEADRGAVTAQKVESYSGAIVLSRVTENRESRKKKAKGFAALLKRNFAHLQEISIIKCSWLTTEAVHHIFGNFHQTLGRMNFTDSTIMGEGWSCNSGAIEAHEMAFSLDFETNNKDKSRQKEFRLILPSGRAFQFSAPQPPAHQTAGSATTAHAAGAVDKK